MKYLIICILTLSLYAGINIDAKTRAILLSDDKEKMEKWGRETFKSYKDNNLFIYDVINAFVRVGNLKVAEEEVVSCNVDKYDYFYYFIEKAYKEKNIKLLKILLKHPERTKDYNIETFFEQLFKDRNTDLLALVYDEKIMNESMLCNLTREVVKSDDDKYFHFLLNSKQFKQVLTCRELIFISGEKTTQILIDKGIDIEQKIGYRTPLSYKFGKRTQVLINAGANLKIEDPSGNMPIHLASGPNFYDEDEQMRKRMTSIKSFLAAGIDVNVKTYAGVTPLMRAAATGGVDVVKLLLKNGANLNQEDDYHQTALAYAVKKDTLSTASYLYGVGGRLSKRSYNKSIINIAVSNNSKKVVKYFVKKENRKNAKTAFYDMNALTEYLSKYDGSDMKMVKILVEGGYDVNAQSKFSGITPLHLAQSVEMAKYLVAHGAVMKKDRNGKTPLDFAIKHKNKEMIAYLSSLKKGIK